MAVGEGRALLADQAQQAPEHCSSSEEQCSELVGPGPDFLCKNHAGGQRHQQLPGSILAWQAGWQREHSCFWDLYSSCWVTGTSMPFILIPPYKPYLCFQQQITPDMFLESNMMDKNWRQKSSLMYCSFRVKHSIAKWWAATQELNVILCLKIKLQLI